MLELASIGLSDGEIAARLNVSLRAVHFHIEKIFRMFGVRNRSEAIAMWMDSRSHAPRPADECPYPKPFRDHFAECPAYEARQVVTLDERAHPTGRSWTCRHLVGQLMRKTEGGWYGACVLGDIGARKRWANRVGPDRVLAVNRLMEELAPVTGPFTYRLWELKADQALAQDLKEDPRPAAQSMEALAGRFMDDLRRILNRHRDLLEQNQLSIDKCLDLAGRLIDRVLDQTSQAAWDNRFDALMRVPADLWSALPSNSHAGAIPAGR